MFNCISGLPRPFHQFGLLVALASRWSLTWCQSQGLEFESWLSQFILKLPPLRSVRTFGCVGSALSLTRKKCLFIANPKSGNICKIGIRCSYPFSRRICILELKVHNLFYTIDSKGYTWYLFTSFSRSKKGTPYGCAKLNWFKSVQVYRKLYYQHLKHQYRFIYYKRYLDFLFSNTCLVVHHYILEHTGL